MKIVRIIKIIQITSGVISLFFGIIALVFIVILPMMGIYFDYNIRGASMEPTFTNAVDIRLGPKWAPYEKLQVGDIIVFREKDYRENNGPPGTVYVPEWNKDQTKLRILPQTEIEEAPKYIRVLHRIIAIKETGLVTKGDKNEFQDFLLVKPEDYEGKIVWHMNHISWLFKVMYLHGLLSGFIILSYVLHLYLRHNNRQTFRYNKHDLNS